VISAPVFYKGHRYNTGLQANPYTSSFGAGLIAFDSTCSGSTIIGLDNIYFGVGPNLGSATDNITITRCNLSSITQYYGYTANTKMVGWKVNKCYINTLSLSPLVIQNWEITNNIITAGLGCK
jgi:hypothetical protein